MVICIANKEKSSVEWACRLLNRWHAERGSGSGCCGAVLRGSYWFPSVSVELRMSKHTPEE